MLVSKARVAASSFYLNANRANNHDYLPFVVGPPTAISGNTPSDVRRRSSPCLKRTDVTKCREMSADPTSISGASLDIGDISPIGRILCFPFLEAAISIRPNLDDFALDGAKFAAHLVVLGGISPDDSLRLSLQMNRKYRLMDLRDERYSKRDLLFSLILLEVSTTWWEIETRDSQISK